MEPSDVDEELALDHRIYGTAMWVLVEGKKVRIPPSEWLKVNLPADSASDNDRRP